MPRNESSDARGQGRPVAINRERRPDVRPAPMAKDRPPENRTSNTGTARQHGTSDEVKSPVNSVRKAVN
jgi:hypothetical protein